MDNFFIDQEPFASNKQFFVAGFVNRVLTLFKSRYRLQTEPDPVVDMTTVEQRINYFHLLDSVIANDVPGDVVELGCFTGQSAMVFQKIIEMHQSEKIMHLYDNFESKFRIKGSVEAVLKENFNKAGLKLPIIHKGYFEETVPQQLPLTISFAHIDCGFGGDPSLHKKIVLDCLKAVYPRMSKNAVCVLMDYQDESVAGRGYNPNPGVRLACDGFFVQKPEKVVGLYGNQYFHGFFRKMT